MNAGHRTWKGVNQLGIGVNDNVYLAIWVKTKGSITQFLILLQTIKKVRLLAGHKMKLFSNNMFNLRLLMACIKELGDIQLKQSRSLLLN